MFDPISCIGMLLRRVVATLESCSVVGDVVIPPLTLNDTC